MTNKFFFFFFMKIEGHMHFAKDVTPFYHSISQTNKTHSLNALSSSNQISEGHKAVTIICPKES